ncbi:MAG: O-succinylhomoserine sulfhydrylase [Gammaproteobacteria bacterium]|nr:O-succinylhomoserine sulfhydrylase [bacterium AH-315-E07]PCH61060.1 MAG: O-succinylhomoserine sulfhydrylase [Gammaproteobacteria bacterium]
MSRDSELGIRTRAVRTGTTRSHEGEHSESIFATSSFVCDSAAQAAARFSGEEPGNLYSRFTNPSVRMFEERLASMEGGECCVGTSSGMAAINAVMMGLLKAGDHVVCSRNVFGSTILLFKNIMARFGVEASFVSLTDTQAWENAITSNTRLLFLETPGNPLTEVADLAALADIAHKHDALLVVDNCFCTPVLQRPLELGADIVVHSATKYIDGQGRGLGGAVVGSKKLVGGDIYSYCRTTGPTMSPFNAWIFLHGLETLSVRMRGHCENAMAVARWLYEHPAVVKVNYPGLETHPQHALAKKQQLDFGGIVSFEVKGGQDDAWTVIDNTQFISITANLGDVKSTITHPATTTHGRLTEEDRELAGITRSLVRVSVGLEDVDDIKADLDRGLSKLV